MKRFFEVFTYYALAPLLALLIALAFGYGYNNREASGSQYWSIVNAWPTLPGDLRGRIRTAMTSGKLSNRSATELSEVIINRQGLLESGTPGSELDQAKERAQLQALVRSQNTP